MASKNIGLRLPEDLAEEFKQFCEGGGKSTTEVLRKWVDEALHPRPGQGAELAEKASRISQLEEQVAGLREKDDTSTGQIDRLNGTVAELEEQQLERVGKAGQLELQVADLQSPEHRREVLGDWLKGMTPELYFELAGKLGYQVESVRATEAEEAEVAEPEDGPEERPGIIEGKTDEPGYRYLDLVGISVRVD